jgi:5'-3' exonuclease
LNTSSVRGDCGTLYSHVVLKDCFGSLFCDRIVGGISVLDAKIIVLKFDVHKGKDQLKKKKKEIRRLTEERSSNQKKKRVLKMPFLGCPSK